METAQLLQIDSVERAPVAIFVATGAEAKPLCRALRGTRVASGRSGPVERIELDGRPLLVVRTGIGQANAETAARRLLDAMPVSAALSVGLAAGLSPQLRSGDVIVGERVILPRETATTPANLASDPALQEWVLRLLRRSGDRHDRGGIVTVERIILTAEEKRGLAARSGAIAADMESGAIAAAATARGIPFLAIRAILDPAHEALTIAFERFLDVRGEPRWPQLCRYLLTHPLSLPSLVSLGLRTQAACVRLGHLLRGLSTIPGRGEKI
jgi:adenosylhomocysteine nucleosidase